MTTKRSTKNALLSSVLALFLCFTMLIGTTFAWFTDSVTSGSNIIKAGNLDIVLEYFDGNSWVDAEGKVIPFVAADGRDQSQILWEPGCTYNMAPFRVRNAGNLNAKILIMINGVVGDAKLLEAIEFKTHINNIPQSVLEGSAGNQLQRFEGAELGIMYGMPEGNIVFDWSLAGKGTTTPGTGHTDTSPEFTISGHMAEEAGNEYMNLAIEGISITIIATQQSFESDSFDKWYDKNATFPNVSSPAVIPVEDVVAPVILNAKNMQVEVPAELINDLPADVTSVQLIFSEPVAENNELHFAYIELVDQNGEKIDLSANDHELVIKLPAQTTFAPGTTVEIYHDGEKMAIASVEADGTISYSALHLCEVDVTDPQDAYYVANYDEFYTEVYYGGMVIPTADIEITNYLGTAGTADIYLNGKTLTEKGSIAVFYAPQNGSKLSVNGVGTVITAAGYAGFATKSGVLTVNGGTFNLGNTNNASHFYAQNSGKIVINGGTFVSNDADTPIVYCINGFIEINGGFFQNTANSKQALISMGNNLQYVNNQKITLSGGTFVNWNPMSSAFAQAWTNPDVPALIVLADGYEMISETQENGDVWYMVVPVEQAQ